ncbi:MAG: isoaspartyl peptidase/L-asparaginase [Mycoplasmatales bacterium]
MKVKMIATWSMSMNGLEKAIPIIDKSSKLAIEKAIKDVEDNELFDSVGYGGLPNINGEVQLDAAFMDGDTLKMGGFAGSENIANPIEVAISLSKEKYNNFLVGRGAEKYTLSNGFKIKNMLSQSAHEKYENKRPNFDSEDLNSYDGHDTVCIIGIDSAKKMCVGTSTSGLFMKKEGRIGDTMISGSGFYADSDIGAAAATGVGEDLMRGCISYKTLSNLEMGFNVQDAVESALREFIKKMEKKGQKSRAMSIIAMDKDNNFGVATNCYFTFVVMTSDGKIIDFVANEVDGVTKYNVKGE